MTHLSSETLARIVDEGPNEEEQRHLDACATCADELEAFRAQRAQLGQLPDLRPPLGDWYHLEARLVSEGLLKRKTLLSRLAMTPAWMRAAAAVLLFVSGGAVGIGLAHSGLLANEPGLEETFEDLATRVTSDEEAAELVRSAESVYMQALYSSRRLAADGAGEAFVSDPESYFTALEYVVLASQAAVRQAPADPFLNGLLVSAMAEREAALQRISASSSENWF